MFDLFSWLVDKKEVDSKLLEIAKGSPLMEDVRIVLCKDDVYRIQEKRRYCGDAELWVNRYTTESKDLVDVERHFIKIFENREANKRSRTIRKVL